MGGVVAANADDFTGRDRGDELYVSEGICRAALREIQRTRNAQG